MIRKSIILFIIALSIVSCRNNNFTPSEPKSQIKPDTDFQIFEEPEKADIYYLGDIVPIRFKSFSNSKTIDIHVVKKGTLRYVIGTNIQNTGSYSWQTNENIIPSVHYQIKLIDPKDERIYALSESFAVIQK